MAQTTQVLKVVEVFKLTPEVACLRLEDPERKSLPAFSAGSHIDVHLQDGIVRQYSLCGHTTNSDHYLIAVKLEPNSRGGSKAMHDFKQGSLLTIGAPRNNFPISDKAGFHLLLAGGIGITPLLSMARELKRQSKSFQLEYFTRSTENTPFRDDIKNELGANAHFNVALEPNQVREHLAQILAKRTADAHLYVCGPSLFISMVTEIAAQQWPADTVHLEHFTPQKIEGQTENKPFKVTLSQSNRQFDVPADKSILDVLRENNVPCDSSCREGTCGSCMVAIVEGEVEHRDSYLSTAEKEQGEVMMICVSRPKKGDLIIDL